jgi:muramidase (phage lysozyme)
VEKRQSPGEPAALSISEALLWNADDSNVFWPESTTSGQKTRHPEKRYDIRRNVATSGEMSRHPEKCRDIRRNVATSGEMSRHPEKCRDIWRNVATSGEMSRHLEEQNIP